MDKDELSRGYDYLLSMKIWSLTLERVRMLENELEAKTKEMAQLRVRIPVFVVRPTTTCHLDPITDQACPTTRLKFL